MKLTHTQAYLLGSIAKHSSNYRLALQSLRNSVEAGEKGGVRQGFHIDAARKADYSSKVVDELLDQLYEEFADRDPATIESLVSFAIQPTERGTRRRFNTDEEF